MDNPTYTTESAAITTQYPTAPHATVQPKSDSGKRNIGIFIAIGVLIILAILIGFIIFLAQPATDTAKVRDIFIIFMALSSLLFGIVLIILVVQVAILVNLLQNEIKPILTSTNETVNNLRGTTLFLSDNLVAPVIKMNEYLAAITQVARFVGFVKKGPKSK